MGECGMYFSTYRYWHMIKTDSDQKGLFQPNLEKLQVETDEGKNEHAIL